MAKNKESVEQIVRNIRRKTRKQFSAEEKIRIVLEGFRGESTVAELCRREGIAQSLYYNGFDINQPHLTDFDALQHARTQYPPQVLDVITSNLESSLHSNVLIDKNAVMKLLGNVGGIKRNHPDRSYSGRSAVLLAFLADQSEA